ncbi:MAG: hypothetical protein L3J17_08550 [Candidatus Jettenia sp.]|nr:MAG: hypothetical protein L3J17_08550 [Candidatus Jettenia sp.]
MKKAEVKMYLLGKEEVGMMQEKKNCKKCGMLFTPSQNNPKYCPEHQRKKNSILGYLKIGGIIIVGATTWILLKRGKDNDSSV